MPPYLEALPHPPLQRPPSASSSAAAATPPAPMAALAPVIPQPEHAEPANDMHSTVEQGGGGEGEALTEPTIGEPASGSSGAREAPANDEATVPDLVNEEGAGSQGPERPVLEKSSPLSKSWRGSGTKVKVSLAHWRACPPEERSKSYTLNTVICLP